MKIDKVYLIFLLTLTTLYGQFNFKKKIEALTQEISNPRSESDISTPIKNPFLMQRTRVHNSSKNGICKPFDIKTATKEEFSQIDSIDRFLAKKIVLYRKKNGLNSIEDFRQIIGIGDIEFQQLKRYILKSRECLKRKKTKHRKKKSKQITIQKRWKLQLIINNWAKISNRWYKEGDLIQGHKIKKIGFDFVRIQKRYSTKVLRFKRVPKNRNIIMEIK